MPNQLKTPKRWRKIQETCIMPTNNVPGDKTAKEYGCCGRPNRGEKSKDFHTFHLRKTKFRHNASNQAEK